jgi:hypothetical protein
MIPIDTFLSTSYAIFNLGIVILATVITTRTCRKEEISPEYTQQIIRSHRYLQLVGGVFVCIIGIYNMIYSKKRPCTQSNRILQSITQIATGTSLIVLVILTFIVPEWLNGWVCQPLQIVD